MAPLAIIVPFVVLGILTIVIMSVIIRSAIEESKGRDARIAARKSDDENGA